MKRTPRRSARHCSPTVGQNGSISREKKTVELLLVLKEDGARRISIFLKGAESGFQWDFDFVIYRRAISLSIFFAKTHR